MRITLREFAKPGERFAADAFDGNVGKRVRVNVGPVHTTGVCTSAKVASNGRSVIISVEIEEGTP
jgi:hypothetical protein